MRFKVADDWTQALTDYVNALVEEQRADVKAFYANRGAERALAVRSFLQQLIARIEPLVPR
jgi:hypothetical protein